MRPVESSLEMPARREAVLRRAIVLQWVSIGYFLSVVVLMYLVMGASQAMKTAWIEDLLSLIPPIVFLLASWIRNWPATKTFPYGYHRIVSIGFLVSALTLLSMGLILLIDGIIKLIQAEHPTIGTVDLFGTPIWLGWLMLPVLVWSGVPSVFLGRAKLEPARLLHDKILYTDAEMNKADWLTALSAFLGVGAIALGWWWGDALAAMVISLSIIHDGAVNLWAAVTDLMDRAPRSVDHQRAEALPARLVTELEKLPWVKEVQVRLREDGHVFFGEVFLTPVDRRNLLARVEEARELAYRLDWRLKEVVIQLMSEESTTDNDARKEPKKG